MRLFLNRVNLIAVLATSAFVTSTILYVSCKSHAQSITPAGTLDDSDRTTALHQTASDVSKELEQMDVMTRKQREKIPVHAQASLEQLSDVLEEKLALKDNDVQCHAAYLIGLYRLESSSQNLVNSIDLRDRVMRKNNPFGPNEPWWWGSYPAAEALVRIGQPAVDSILGLLEDGASNNRRVLALWVICSVNQQDKDVTVLILKKAVAAASSESKRRNLEVALKVFQENGPDKLMSLLKK